MFELSIALKYLIPKWRQLSVSIISIISIFVIALVVWLILVFFSVTNGLEKVWSTKITALTAPIRIVPTEDYFHSYYHMIDAVSENSDYVTKSIREKALASQSDPYDPTQDEALPSQWPEPDRKKDGSLKDLVKEAVEATKSVRAVNDLNITPFELAFSTIRLRLIRPSQTKGLSEITEKESVPSYINHSVYLGSFEQHNPLFSQAVLQPSAHDISNLLRSLSFSGITGDGEGELKKVSQLVWQKRLKRFFDALQIKQLKAPSYGWAIPQKWGPDGVWKGLASFSSDGRLVHVVIPTEQKALSHYATASKAKGVDVIQGAVSKSNGKWMFTVDGDKKIHAIPPGRVYLQGNTSLVAELDEKELNKAKKTKDIPFQLEAKVQGTSWKGKQSLGSLEMDKLNITTSFQNAPQNQPLWIYQIQNGSKKSTWALPSDSDLGDGVLLPKSFRDAGVLLGDAGFLSYYTPTASTVQEQRIPIYVAGFFDHGVMPMGSKFVLVPPEVTTLVRASYDHQDQNGSTAGLYVRFGDIGKADQVKADLQQEFNKRGISRYWTIETYKEFDFTKDLLQQLKSEKNLFMLIAVVIIIVACSNIISMLIILVNDKKIEIGILRAMGATSKQIATIFGVCGVLMGAVGSITGILFALLTLNNLDSLIDWMGRLQGHEMFNATYFGDTLPNELSYEALLFVLVTTVCLSLLAGIIPALKASLVKPSSILRAE